MARITYVLIDGYEIPLPEGYIVEEDEDFLYIARPGSTIIEIYSSKGITNGRQILNILANHDMNYDKDSSNPVDELLKDLGIRVDFSKDEMDYYKF